MKSEGAIRHKLKNVLFYHLKKAVKKKMVQKSWNCAYESEKPSRVEEGSKIRICRTCTLLGGACDDSDESVPSRARQCPQFQSKYDPEKIKLQFQSELETLDTGEFAYRYPDAFALMWVLDMDSAGELASSIERIDTEDVTPPSPLDPLVASLAEVRDAVVTLNQTLEAAPKEVDPALADQFQELADRLEGLEKNVPAEAPRSFWASLFGSK